MLAGRRQIFVRLPGCNLNCSYCDTNYEKCDICRIETKPGSGVFTDLPQPLPLQKITAVISSWQSLLPGVHHSISFTGGEPLLKADSLAEWFPEIRKIIPVHLETNGTMIISLMGLIEHVDFISMDMKLPSTSGCTEHLWELHHHFLEEAHRSDVSVKIVVGESTDDCEIDRVCEIILRVAPSIPLFIQPITKPDGSIGISAAHILHIQEFASSRLPDVRVIPQMHKLLGVL